MDRHFSPLGLDAPAVNSLAFFTNQAALDGYSSRFNMANDHSSHPDFGHLVILVLQAVAEVALVAGPGYYFARKGMFTAENQGWLARMNINLFTPCLIFYKLSNNVNKDDLPGLAAIPVIFVVQTLISWFSASVMSWAFRLKKRGRNFVTAMAVFGNSNSLPISLVTSLAFTIKGLHWAKEPHDNDGSVAARGIIYLLIFQQLGQLLRWTWGLNVLLKPPTQYEYDEMEDFEAKVLRDSRMEAANDNLLADYSDQDSVSSGTQGASDSALIKVNSRSPPPASASGSATPRNANNTHIGQSESITLPPAAYASDDRQGTYKPLTFDQPLPTGPKGWWMRLVRAYRSTRHFVAFKSTSAWHFVVSSVLQPMASAVSSTSKQAFSLLPKPLQGLLKTIALGLWKSVSAPLVAMVLALPLVIFPQIHAFFYHTPFLAHSLIPAISQTGSVAVPLIIFSLGASLAKNTLPSEQRSAENTKLERKIIIASIISRLVLPLIFMTPFLVLVAKHVKWNIIDDPIFVVVVFLLAGAPTALQLSQITQINGVYQGTMAQISLHGYVIWVLPSTLILVMLALETLEYAAAGKMKQL